MGNLFSIRGLVFDLFHTLVSLEVSKAPGRSTPEILGIDPEVWYHHWLNDPDDYVLGLTPVDVPIRRLARTLNPLVTEKDIQEVIKSRHERFRHTLLNVKPETIESLRTLRARGFKLGLISNCGKDEIAHWSDSPLAPFFDSTTFSCEVKLKKPDPAIYLLTARNLNLSPEQCLYIGNGGSSELKGAKDAGMAPVLLTYHLEIIKPQRILEVIADARFIVRKVSDLILLLGNQGGAQ